MLTFYSIDCTDGDGEEDQRMGQEDRHGVWICGDSRRTGSEFRAVAIQKKFELIIS